MPRPVNPALEALWQLRVRQQPDSGLTIHQFCQREGVSTASFHAWKRRLALRATLPVAFSSRKSAFVPVIVPSVPKSQPHDSTDLITIQLANGGRTLLPIAAGVDLVCQVVETVARSSAAWEDPSC
ncbi:MAG: hypothetical protein P4L84_21605 [Isosphaeraceae bacterium]|nr:hypothetical protein [Isosphaeraceae bacterium]